MLYNLTLLNLSVFIDLSAVFLGLYDAVCSLMFSNNRLRVIYTQGNFNIEDLFCIRQVLLHFSQLSSLIQNWPLRDLPRHQHIVNISTVMLQSTRFRLAWWNGDTCGYGLVKLHRGSDSGNRPKWLQWILLRGIIVKRGNPILNPHIF